MGLIVGLTGSMGSGKTTVASLFKKLGASVIDADAICRELVHPHLPAWQEITDAFGSHLLKEDRSIDRKKLAELVFNDGKKKSLLEKILHPKVFAEEARLIEQFLKEDPQSLIIIEAALLIESGNYQKMNKVIVVTGDQEQLIQRAMNRGSLTRGEAQKRIQNQMSQEEKIKMADYILQNDGGRKDLETKVRALFHELKTGP